MQDINTTFSESMRRLSGELPQVDTISNMERQMSTWGYPGNFMFWNYDSKTRLQEQRKLKFADVLPQPSYDVAVAQKRLDHEKEKREKAHRIANYCVEQAKLSKEKLKRAKSILQGVCDMFDP